ncbi:hypothetical protein QO034_17215 [Sedimentitalea sp. JM2-8]|uniref:Uncharacterized protein n=1 Tax=Sedimentitalea xiamensis TaxID=3050037 RepID=A0ABT7FI68_9RHOB|nr:hypothetical protein [Sedimentitalea xiamensis]MDK3074830.1 hypothetical protein [Sedimentitalea xiamensis]
MKDDTRFNAGRFSDGRFSGKKPKDRTGHFEVSVSGLTENPDFGLTAQIGVPLTATAVNWSGDAPGSVAWQWLDSSGPIGTGATYTPQASDDLESIYAVAVPSEIYAQQNSTSYTVRHAPPIPGSGISSKNLTYLGDEKTIIQNARNRFTGDGLTFSVSGYAGARLDGKSLIIDPTDLTAGTTVRLTATNSGGSVSHAFNLVVEAL